jgi:hypothetical protein
MINQDGDNDSDPDRTDDHGSDPDRTDDPDSDTDTDVTTSPTVGVAAENAAAWMLNQDGDPESDPDRTDNPEADPDRTDDPDSDTDSDVTTNPTGQQQQLGATPSPPSAFPGQQQQLGAAPSQPSVSLDQQQQQRQLGAAPTHPSVFLGQQQQLGATLTPRLRVTHVPSSQQTKLTSLYRQVRHPVNFPHPPMYHPVDPMFFNTNE